jgi:putative FmdB family regulatory protein
MPTYEYVCEKCGRTFEAFQRMTEEPLKTCIDQACGGSVHRLLSGGAGFIFKGAGFYATDYRSDSYKKAAEKDKGSGSSSSSGSSSPGAATKKSGDKGGSKDSGGASDKGTKPSVST